MKDWNVHNSLKVGDKVKVIENSGSPGKCGVVDTISKRANTVYGRVVAVKVIAEGQEIILFANENQIVLGAKRVRIYIQDYPILRVIYDYNH